MQRVHFQVRVDVSVVKTNIYFIVFDIVVKNKSNVVKCGLYSCRQRYPSLRGQNVVQQIELHHKAHAFALVF